MINNNALVVSKSSTQLMRKYNALNGVYRRAYIGGLISCLPIAQHAKIHLFKERSAESKGLIVAWRTVGDAIGNAMLRVK